MPCNCKFCPASPPLGGLVLIDQHWGNSGKKAHYILGIFFVTVAFKEPKHNPQKRICLNKTKHRKGKTFSFRIPMNPLTYISLPQTWEEEKLNSQLAFPTPFKAP